MSSEKVTNINELEFDETAYSNQAVDSTTQQLLFTGSGKPELWFISNVSANKRLWIKPNDNTTSKRGIQVPPGLTLPLPVRTDVSIYAIMDSGGSVTIELLRLF